MAGVGGDDAGTCVNACGGYGAGNNGNSCYCDASCTSYGDCCADIDAQCGSAAACASDGECNPGSDGSGLICVNGQCVPGCNANWQCPGNTSCVSGQCL